MATEINYSIFINETTGVFTPQREIIVDGAFITKQQITYAELEQKAPNLIQELYASLAEKLLLSSEYLATKTEFSLESYEEMAKLFLILRNFIDGFSIDGTYWVPAGDVEKYPNLIRSQDEV
jgi:hypothetical protein